MTYTDFNHLLASVEALSPDQMRRLLRELESRIAAAARRAAPGKPAIVAKTRRDATKPAESKKEPRTEAEVLQHMLDIGLITQLPDTDADFDDPDDEPVTIKGEPLSETVIRERR